MRTIALLLLGLLALAGAQPGCATIAAPHRTAHATPAVGEHCPPHRHERRQQSCAAACLGCALAPAYAALRMPAAIRRARPLAAEPTRLAGRHPITAIPPPRSLA